MVELKFDATPLAQATMGGLLELLDGNISRVKSCPTLLWSRYDNDNTDPYLMMGLTDGGWVNQLSENQPTDQALQKNVDAIKPMLNGKH